jgi:hypothetical protein
MRCSTAGFFVSLIAAMAALPAAASAQVNRPVYEPLQTCLALAPDCTPIYPSEVFPVATEIDAVFHGVKGKTLKHEWFAVDTGGAIPPNTSLVAGTLDISNVNSGFMSFSGGQKPGKYRLDVSIDGTPWKSVNFSINPTMAAPPLQSPKDLVRLTKGTTWTYDDVQKVFYGAKVSPPEGITPDADGTLRFHVTFAVVGNDDIGTKIELRRNDQLAYTDWEQLGNSGYTFMQRKAGNDLEVYKPPMVLWPWPLSPTSWTYEADDHSMKQSSQMWGPLPVDGPSGTVPGYVIMVKQDAPPKQVTQEEHFVPGLGLVKEITLTTVRNFLACREEMTLTQVKN